MTVSLRTELGFWQDQNRHEKPKKTMPCVRRKVKSGGLACRAANGRDQALPLIQRVSAKPRDRQKRLAAR